MFSHSTQLKSVAETSRTAVNTKHTWLDVQEEGVSTAAAAVKEAQGLATEKERRLLAVTQKQDKLLYLCAYLLLNLSEDPDIERKMQKKVRCCAGLGLTSSAGYTSSPVCTPTTM